MNIVKMKGHEEEGFGLDWNSIKPNYLLSGSNDKKIIAWDINSSNKESPFWSIDSEDCVEDVKWSKFN